MTSDQTDSFRIEVVCDLLTGRLPAFGKFGIDETGIFVRSGLRNGWICLAGPANEQSEPIVMFKSPVVFGFPGFELVVRYAGSHALVGPLMSRKRLITALDAYGFETRTVHVPYIVAGIAPALWPYVERRGFFVAESSGR
ncbi:MAG: hypothetical protein ACPGYP_09360 [Solirubrobacterales bacterium]